MYRDEKANNHSETLIKFLAPQDRKQAPEELAAERNMALSALLRPVASEYVKRTRQTW